MLRVLPALVYLLLYMFTATAAADNRPNVLLLLADDFGYNDSAIYQDIFHQKPVAAMPVLESFAKEGVRFTRFYTESTCSSSRAALITGQYAARNGFMPVARGISPGVVTLPEYLKTRGYVTHLVGKWHVGEVNHEAFPENQGFDTTFGFLGQWFLRGPDKDGGPELKPPTYKNPWLRATDHHEKLSYQPYQGHLEDILTEHTVQLIQHESQSASPWFIYHAFFAPHTPLEPSERFAKQFPDTPEGKYQAMLAQMDDSLQHIFSALKKSGQWDNTIIIFLSDNGSPEKHAESNAPFSGGKSEYEEGGIRTPLAIKWDKLHSFSGTRNDAVSIMDIYPSIVSMLDARSGDFKKFDGIPSLAKNNPESRNSPLYFLSFGSMSVLSADGHYRLLREWDAQKITRTQLFKYDESGIPFDTSESLLEKIFDISGKLKIELFNDFLQWRQRLNMVPVYMKKQAVKGSDFLRTPINPSFAVAFSFKAVDVNARQTLFSQKNTMEVYLEKGVLYGNIHGLQVKTLTVQPNICYRVVLSGEFYDRYSGVQNDVRTSHLHLMVDGKMVDTANGKIMSFETIDITSPTVIEKINGSISQPVFFSAQLLPDDKPIPSGFDEVMGLLSACRAE